MTKTTTAGMDTHLQQEVTSLATAAVIERTDGQKFRLTSSAEDVDIDIGDGDGVQTYSASEGVSKTNIESDAELNVDNLDIVGIFTNDQLQETELRRGLFDFADFKIFAFNHQDISDGIIKIFRGQLGEVITTREGYFQVQVRSITQVYSKQTGEKYSKDCRADLGDIRCTMPIIPNEIQPNTIYAQDEYLIVPTDPANNDCAQIIMNFEGVDGATSGVGFDNIGTDGSQPTINGTAQIDTAQMPAGGDSTSSLLLDGNSDWLSWTDRPAFELGTGEVTISADIRMDLVSVDQCIASKFDGTGNQRSWLLRVNSSNNLEFEVFDTGGSTADVTLTGTTTMAIGTDYHVAVVRKGDGDWVLFLDGGIEAGPTTPTGDPFDGSGDFRIGALEDVTVTELFNGWIDSFELVVGFARWEAAFTPPTGNKTNVNPTLIWEDFGDRVYVVTQAGTSANCINKPDETILNTHSQGGAVLEANHSWMRFAQVSAVSSTEPRRSFTVTELTPISGHNTGANRLPSSLGFADDWFNGGAVLFQTGDNDGRAVEVRDFASGASTQDIELITDMPFDIQVGDKLRVFPGCDKRKETCITKFNNAINSVAEWFVPGEDILGQYPDAR